VSKSPSLPRPFVALGISTVSLAVVLILVLWSTLAPAMWAFLILIGLLAVISENFAPVIGNYAISLAMPLAVCAMLLQGPSAAALVAGASVLSAWTFSSRRGLVVSAYNMGQLILVSLAAGWFYLRLGGRLLATASVTSPFYAGDFPRVLLPLFGLAIALAVGNAAMTALGIAVLHRVRLRDTLESAITHVPSLLALVAVGILMAQVTATRFVALILFIFPLVVARDLYQRYRSLKDAYTDTIRSLVGAIEAKDPYTRGHSERVAAFAVEIGHAMSLDAKSCEKLETAGLLHDLGKIALPRSILTKPGRLTPAELSLMRDHPEAGAAMVNRIPSLSELSEYVVQHHERYSGSGYPSGNVGADVHLLSRILTVADAYDAMTSNRAYRAAMTCECARRVLLEESGAQFDPAVVAAFQRTWRDEVASPEAISVIGKPGTQSPEPAASGGA
jgi:HD-GYP domain-containing protein (c-di-GMP phosphodiesterase class II)